MRTRAAACAVVAATSALVAASALPASGPSGEILFTRTTGKHADLYVMNADGSQARPFLQNASDAAVSWDGNWIAFVRGNAIWVSGRDGTDRRQVTRHAKRVQDYMPAWSWDSRTLFFSRWNGRWLPTGYQSIFSVSVDGSHLRRLTRPTDRCMAPYGDPQEPPNQDVDPAPSPAGHVLAYTGWCYRGAYGTIFGISPSGRPLNRGLKLFDDFMQQYSAAWSPDGASLAFSGAVEDTSDTPPWDIRTHVAINVASRTRAPRLVARFANGDADEPAWSPDGRWIVFTRMPSDVPETQRVSQLWLARADGEGRWQLTGGLPTDSHPAWLPPAG